MPDAPQARFCYTALPFPSFLLGFAPNESSIGKHGILDRGADTRVRFFGLGVS